MEEKGKIEPLNDRQELFCKEYIIDFNGTKAAIRAGYSEKTAKEIASENLTKLNIAARVTELKADIFDAVGITQAKIYRELARVALYDIRKAYDENGSLKSIHLIDDDTAAAIIGLDVDEIWGYNVTEDRKEIQGETKKVKFADKLNALNQLIKIGGWSAPEKSEVTFPNGVQLLPGQFDTLLSKINDATSG